MVSSCNRYDVQIHEKVTNAGPRPPATQDYRPGIGTTGKLSFPSGETLWTAKK